jgi:hypothetical protein
MFSHLSLCRNAQNHANILSITFSIRDATKPEPKAFPLAAFVADEKVRYITRWIEFRED